MSNITPITTDSSGRNQLIVFLRNGNYVHFKTSDDSIEFIVKELERSLANNTDFLLRYTSSNVPSCRIRNNDIIGYKICVRGQGEYQDNKYIGGSLNVLLDYEPRANLPITLNLDRDIADSLHGITLPVELKMDCDENLNINIKNDPHR